MTLWGVDLRLGIITLMALTTVMATLVLGTLHQTSIKWPQMAFLVREVSIPQGGQ